MHLRTCLIAVLIGCCFASIAEAQHHFYVPSTVSEGWRKYLDSRTDPALNPPAPATSDRAAWKQAYEAEETARRPRAAEFAKSVGATISEMQLNGVQALEIKPKDWQDNGKIVVYTHGGGYTKLSPYSTLPNSALLAETTGLRVISIDYTLAPVAKWEQITDQVIAVIQVLEQQGTSLKDIAIFGDSAGGGLAAGTVLKMRDKGLGMPAAVVLWSPWADITETGDTYATLKDADPSYLYDRQLKSSADAYADPADQKNPYVSPVYGDYSKGFPPTIIQGGTKEIFLSNFVRLYQAIDGAGQIAKLDLYEGMPHVFQGKLPESPESKSALCKVKAFLSQHLGK